MIQVVQPAEFAVINENFIQQLEKDIKNYDILYICAPLGWGKDLLMQEIYSRRNGQRAFFWLDDTEEQTMEQQIQALPATGRKILVIPNLEKIMECGKEHLVWNLLNKKKKDDVFLIASTMTVPERMLPYTLMNRFISYGIDAIRPSNQDVAVYMKNRGISLSEEELLLIERDTNNVPLFVQMLSNLMAGSTRGYHRGLKEQCYQDVFTYIDVVHFRTFSTQDQNALMKLSYFKSFDNTLISNMLGTGMRETEAFLERIYHQSSIIKKTKNGWKFQTVFKFFLDRAVHKYLDYEERTSDYKKAMKYMLQQKSWKEALHFAYILKEKEQIAYCMIRLLEKEFDYDLFISMEMYFGELTIDNLQKYPELFVGASILKAITGERKAAIWYEQQFVEYMDSIENQQVLWKLEKLLLFMYITRPGNMQEDVLERCMELLQHLRYADSKEQNLEFLPHYISILRGERDYCSYFLQNKTEFIDEFRQVVDSMNSRSYSLMLMHMEAEVCYERNDLDRALNLLAKITREAKLNGYERMTLFCTVSMTDLISSKNQLSVMDSIAWEKLDLNAAEMPTFVKNCRAHMVYYYLLKNEKAQIESWMKMHAPDETEIFYTVQYYQYLIKAKVYIWEKQHVRARMILQLLLEFAKEYKMAYLEAQVRILKAVIYYRENNEQWKTVLKPALEWAKELGFIRIFADEGAAVYELLNRLVQEDKEWSKDEWMKKLVYAVKAHMLQYPKYLKQEKQGNVEEFSESEQAVMRLLVLGGKNAEIASTLCVSENTVKYHLKNIYQKLQVKSRAQAISKIREYELL